MLAQLGKDLRQNKVLSDDGMRLAAPEATVRTGIRGTPGIARLSPWGGNAPNLGIAVHDFANFTSHRASDPQRSREHVHAARARHFATTEQRRALGLGRLSIAVKDRNARIRRRHAPDSESADRPGGTERRDPAAPTARGRTRVAADALVGRMGVSRVRDVAGQPALVAFDDSSWSMCRSAQHRE